MQSKDTKTYCDSAIVLHSVKYGDHQLIVELLTRDHSRRGYICSSKSKSSRRSVFQPMSLIDIEATAPQHGDLHRLSKASIAKSSMTSLGDNGVKSTVKMFVAEMIYRMATDSSALQGFYPFVEALIQSLDDEQDQRAIANYHLYFVAHLARRLGYAPSMRFAKGSWFDIKSGEFTADEPNHTLKMEPALASLLYDLLVIELGELGEISVNRHLRRSFLDSMIDYLNYHTDKVHTIRSIEILSTIFD